ncbi:hypothetical protein GCK72_009177 [Caenorhabditis remanei]|uniref:Uncharacterized protein n=1 Tax=Caenorhabditis remanei TaxID=31234 RepID=A0A6A5H2B3_CAERE|nr:hypothetical protein GCK72_009177 [Caenorhabditis remanei]KAF1760924.1 hypothetical protein GCK72_009177 [Caenorhabditis remanei]
MDRRIYRQYIHEEHKQVYFTTRGIDAAKAGKTLKEKSKRMMEAGFEANRNPDQLPNDRKTTDLTLPEMLSYYMFNIRNTEAIKTIVNILYNCPEVREKYVNCQNPNMPFGNILGRIIRTLLNTRVSPPPVLPL